MNFLIGAHELAPKKCLDCGASLKQPIYSFLEMTRSTDHHIICPCGCVYVWSWDSTGLNGGIWRRRHMMPLFDDRARLEITPEQIAASKRREIFNQKVNEAASERLKAKMDAKRSRQTT